jgi:hypothetical protein
LVLSVFNLCVISLNRAWQEVEGKKNLHRPKKIVLGLPSLLIALSQSVSKASVNIFIASSFSLPLFVFTNKRDELGKVGNRLTKVWLDATFGVHVGEEHQHGWS